ncbi:L,D-transpeptidase family protein [Sphingomonas sp. ASV193]|uniref:L,D-transpeptidase family protein n=1 Tax=Sphingomonas sp. ASV193 TaxID=3144405 RepID=UPI0032E900C3
MQGRTFLIGGIAALGLVTGSVPAWARKKPPPAPVAPAPLPPIAGIDPATLAAVDRFEQSRPGQRLWFNGAALSPAGSALLGRLRSANFDGFPAGPILAARVSSDLAQQNIADADRALSGGYAMLVRLMNTPPAGLRYNEPEAMPRVAGPDMLLITAAQSPNLQSQVDMTLRRSQIYYDLRAAAIADAASRGGTPDPRLMANLERARAIPPVGKVVVVNPATQELLMVQDGQIADRMKVVVGKVETPTHPMVSMLHYITVNPYWNVPSDLVQKILAPRAARGGVAYLNRGHYQIVDGFGAKATVVSPASVDWKKVLSGEQTIQMRQLPGPFNSMGRMKFGFANNYGIYLHDSPSKKLFADDVRVESNGCVRLEDAARLATFLNGSVPKADGTEGDQLVQLPQAVPVYISYLTAQPTGDAVRWANDIYSLDPAGASTLATGQPSVPATPAGLSSPTVASEAMKPVPTSATN